MVRERRKIYNDIQSYVCIDTKANNRKNKHGMKSVQITSVFCNNVAHFYSSK